VTSCAPRRAVDRKLLTGVNGVRRLPKARASTRAKKSIAIAVTIQPREKKTLTDQEIDRGGPAKDRGLGGRRRPAARLRRMSLTGLVPNPKSPPNTATRDLRDRVRVGGRRAGFFRIRLGADFHAAGQQPWRRRRWSPRCC